MPVSLLIREGIARSLTGLGAVVAVADVPLEHPSELERGDYASSAAMKFAKAFNLAPKALAERIVSDLGPVEGVEKIEVAGPGFINVWLAGSSIDSAVQAARSDPAWGNDADGSGRRILIEYTSPNLFKPLHIGNLVGNILGESISRLMQASGSRVTRINYPSDIGLTVAKGVWGLKKLSADPGDIGALGEAYRAGNEAYETDAAAKSEIESINKALYEGSDPELDSLRARGIETSRRHLDAICATLGTRFDFELFESEAAPVGKGIVTSHPEIFPESDGARVFRGEEYGLHTRVFLNSLGLPTYEAKDLGNFSLKQERYPDWTDYYVVTGAEQRDYFKVVLEAIRQVFPEARPKHLEHIANGFLTPTTGKMSSRKGNVITGESLLKDLVEQAKARASESRADDPARLAEQVAVAAIKYQILKQSSGKDIIFDRERALSLEGDSGPYLQYAHARTHQIVARAAAEGVVPATEGVPVSDISRLVHRFPEVVALATEHREPHLVATYLVQLAGSFNAWYAEEQILDGTEKAAGKVALADAVRGTLKRGLWLLGIPAPEKM